MTKACDVRIELHHTDGTITVLKPKVSILEGEIIDASLMSVRRLRDFYEESLQDLPEGVLWSLHLKATMMKVSDPVLFGHAVEVFFKDVFTKHAELFKELGINANNGLGDVYKCIAGHPNQAEIEADLKSCYSTRPPMAHVDSSRGITNLHVPSDIIIDASMAAAIRDSGCMWSADDTLTDTRFVIPDRSYARIYDVVIKDCKKNGAFDVKTMGAVSNVGLMAAKAEEYGSHDKTFVIPAAGTVKVVTCDNEQRVIFSHAADSGDVWRMCQTKDAPIQDWIKLALCRARVSNTKAIFWLSEERAHDRNVLAKVRAFLSSAKASDVDVVVMSPEAAMLETCKRAREGLDTISVTGNVLRDYLTDLFPVIELGTSAKMLSIVPLLAGGGMFETGAGGSAPKHVQQFTKEGHLRWDSLGEYLALTRAFEDLAKNNPKAKVLANALNKAVGQFLIADKNPSRKVKEIDNRGSHYWVARYWSEELSKDSSDAALQKVFADIAGDFASKEASILSEMIDCQGPAADIGGYYKLDKAKADTVMQPSATFNGIIEKLGSA